MSRTSWCVYKGNSKCICSQFSNNNKSFMSKRDKNRIKNSDRMHEVVTNKNVHVDKYPYPSSLVEYGVFDVVELR